MKCLPIHNCSTECDTFLEHFPSCQQSTFSPLSHQQEDILHQHCQEAFLHQQEQRNHFQLLQKQINYLKKRQTHKKKCELLRQHYSSQLQQKQQQLHEQKNCQQQKLQEQTQRQRQTFLQNTQQHQQILSRREYSKTLMVKQRHLQKISESNLKKLESCSLGAISSPPCIQPKFKLRSTCLEDCDFINFYFQKNHLEEPSCTTPDCNEENIEGRCRHFPECCKKSLEVKNQPINFANCCSESHTTPNSSCFEPIHSCRFNNQNIGVFDNKACFRDLELPSYFPNLSEKLNYSQAHTDAKKQAMPTSACHKMSKTGCQRQPESCLCKQIMARLSPKPQQAKDSSEEAFPRCMCENSMSPQKRSNWHKFNTPAYYPGCKCYKLPLSVSDLVKKDSVCSGDREETEWRRGSDRLRRSKQGSEDPIGLECCLEKYCRGVKPMGSALKACCSETREENEGFKVDYQKAERMSNCCGGKEKTETASLNFRNREVESIQSCFVEIQPKTNFTETSRRKVNSIDDSLKKTCSNVKTRVFSKNRRTVSRCTSATRREHSKGTVTTSVDPSLFSVLWSIFYFFVCSVIEFFQAKPDHASSKARSRDKKGPACGTMDRNTAKRCVNELLPCT